MYNKIIQISLHCRSQKAYRTPPAAKWSAIILWLPSGAVGVYILKMDRRLVECKEFRSGQTLEAVDFVKSHAFINTKWTLCPGARYTMSLANTLETAYKVTDY